MITRRYVEKAQSFPEIFSLYLSLPPLWLSVTLSCVNGYDYERI